MPEPLTKPPIHIPRLRPRSTGTARRLESGFTLVELLMGVVLGSLVLGALGGAVLVSQMRVSASIRRDLASKDALNRAVALIRSDIASGSQIQLVNSPAAPSCNGGVNIIRADYGAICYSTARSTVTLPSTSYASGSDRPWSGGCVLTRQGPMFDATTGELVPTTVSTSRVTQVILDDLEQIGTSCSNSFQSSASVGSGLLYGRDVDITIRQTIDQANPAPRVTTFSARSGFNPVYTRMEVSNYTSGSTCQAGVRHIRFTQVTTTTASTYTPTCRNFYYFTNPASAYTIQTGCSYTTCTINSTSLPNVDLLIFADREIRP